MRSIAAVVVPILDVGASGACLLRLGGWKSAAGLLGLLVVLTSVYGAHRIAGLQPEVTVSVKSCESRPCRTWKIICCFAMEF